MGSGAADLCGVVSGIGVFLAIEIKTGGGVKGPDQRAWHRNVLDAGGIAFTCETAEEAMVILRQEIRAWNERHS